MTSGDEKTSAGVFPELEPCDLCGGRRFRRVAFEAGHAIWKCRACGLIQVRPLPVQTAAKNREYWRLDLDNPAILKSRLGSRGVFNRGLDRLEAVTGISVRGKRILDVGCGMGVFLELLREKGAFPYGLDLSPEAVEFTRKQCGLDAVVVGDFESAEFPPGSFDVITGWNVLEHVRSPRRWLEQAWRLLAEDGILFVKVPNVRLSGAASRWTPLLRRLRFPTTSYLASRPPLHLYGFSADTLARVLAESSFKVLSVERAPVRESSGFKGRLVVGLTRLCSLFARDRIGFHPVLMAVARKSGPGKAVP